MQRLRCGVILTDAFLAWLDAWVAEQGSSHEARVLAIEYLRCREGLRAGQAWLEWFWAKRQGVAEHNLFWVNGVDLYLSPTTQKGLKWRCLDAKEGQPYVF